MPRQAIDHRYVGDAYTIVGPPKPKSEYTESRGIPEDERRKKNYLQERFLVLYLNQGPSYKLSGNESKNKDYKEVFLFYTRLYTFADYYRITTLKQLSLRKLYQVLAAFTLYSERIENIMDLVQYSYQNTINYGENTDELRSLVALFTAYRVEKIWQTKSFRHLLIENSEYSIRLIEIMLDRMV